MSAHWARWSTDAARHPWTVGLEEEVMLLDARTWRLANQGEEVLDAAPAALRPSLGAETHACIVELITGVHDTIAGATAELGALRGRLAETCADLGVRAAVSGTHPEATAGDVRVSSHERYAALGAELRALARREPTMALHVHVAVPDGDAAVRALDGLRADLPLVLALAANSPFWRGEDSGFAAFRPQLFSMFPRSGIARAFGRYDEWVAAVDRLVGAGAIPDSSFLWWDARLRPAIGTVEVRVMDAQTRIADTAALAALVQCLVRRHAEGGPVDGGPSEVVCENRFLAARDGLDGGLIDTRTGHLRSVRALLTETLAACAATASRLRCDAELAGVSALAAEPGYRRQRRIAQRYGVAAVTPWAARDFAGTRPAPVPA